ncbi:DUF1365 domain-containing protein [Microbulbifer elongatus]|uniref:DUF1365 domain-containing protein n=1 Tax=Microbulbifer elongatus TaxID=86173 RepID=A0ABT1P3T7_9GAMM|nr:DUF1365 domain-containing protein [Microbulbifer elongatus]MCQ3829711.1 DUF1365 domain-containing protein [Microbulbifer elongatus]
MRSGIYSGWIQHRRFTPRQHGFRYKGFMVFAFLDELPEILGASRLWSTSKFAPARFCREDFFGDPRVPLDQAVRDHVERALCERPRGPIAFLANWRYFGYNMNPISIYYCFDAKGEEVETLLVDVHNTPWNERHGYVLPVGGGRVQRATFDKALHVSPFMPFEQTYHWRSTTPDRRLTVSIRLEQEGDWVFDACMSLQREEISASMLARKLIQYPLFTVKVVGAIYWEALRLLIKRVPFYAHPKT